CCVVMDLLPNYIENLTSKETKELIDNHLKDCKKCKMQFFLLKEKNNQRNLNEEEEDQEEYDYLKKYSKKMFRLKTVITSIFIFVAIFIFIFGGNILYKKNILSKMCNYYDNLMEIDNYSITKQTLYINYNTKEMDSDLKKYYYKDGKIKREVKELADTESFKKETSIYSKMQIVPNEIVEYINTDTKEDITIYTTRKEYAKNEMNQWIEKGSLFSGQFDFTTFKAWFFPYIIQVKNEEYDAKKYYILQYQFNQESEYKQIWINRENFNIERVIEESNTYYRETVYDINKNSVIDNDLIIPNLENYKEVT
ncbi:MAG: zf-HC2 domain-containing protein, partial [Clostridia bacterium]|nr:zf-HC2 domain-containing protein [Clostridia bacterium]